MADESSGSGLEGRLSAEQVRQEQKEVAQALEAGRAGDAKGGTASKEAPEPILKEWIELLMRAAFWALVIYQFVFQVSVVNGNSMEPNIHHGDRLLIDKMVYRFREPKVGEAIVFEAVVKDENGKRVARDYIKRVIARPGDAVKLYDGKVHVNGFVLDENSWDPGEFGYAEQKHAGRETEQFEDPGDPSFNRRLFVVPPGRFFVLGDHRSDSEDSRRSKIGLVHEAQIKGKVRWRFWPFGQMSWY